MCMHMCACGGITGTSGKLFSLPSRGLTSHLVLDGRVTLVHKLCHSLCTVTDVVYKNQTKNKFLNRIRQSTELSLIHI